MYYRFLNNPNQWCKCIIKMMIHPLVVSTLVLNLLSAACFQEAAVTFTWDIDFSVVESGSFTVAGYGSSPVTPSTSTASVTLQSVFNTIPTCIISLSALSMFSINSNSLVIYVDYDDSTSTMTSLKFNYGCTQDSGTTSYGPLIFRYLAYDAANLPQIYSKYVYLESTSNSFPVQLTHFSVKSDGSSTWGLFIAAISTSSINVASRLNLACQYNNSTTLTIKYQPQPQPPSTPSGVYFNRVYLLVVNEVGNTRATIMSLNSNTWKEGARLSFVPSQHYLMGLTSYSFLPSEFNAVLEYNNAMISTDYPYDSLTFTYMALNISFTPNPVIPKIVLTNIISNSFQNNSIQFVLTGVPMNSDSTLGQFNIGSSAIENINKKVDGASIILEGLYTSTLEGLPLQISYFWFDESVANIKLTATIMVVPEGNPPIAYYSEEVKQSRDSLQMVVAIINYVYLGVFALSLFCSKTVGIETILLLHTTMYGLIPVGMPSPPFVGLASMPMISGYNGMFQDVTQVPIPTNYSALGFKANFISNCNIMIMVLLVFPLLWGVFILMSKGVKTLQQKQKWISLAKSFLCQCNLTLILFNCANIYISLELNMESLGMTNTISMVVAVLVALIPIAAAILFIFFRSHFEEFQKELNEEEKVGKFSVETSKKICGMYPFVLICEMILVPLLTGLRSLFGCSLYIILIINLAITIFLVYASPYKDKFNNIRAIGLRVLLLSELVLLILCQVSPSTNVTTFTQVPFAIVSVLGVGSAIGGIGVIYNISKKMKEMLNPTVEQTLSGASLLNKNAVDQIDVTAVHQIGNQVPSDQTRKQVLGQQAETSSNKEMAEIYNSILGEVAAKSLNPQQALLGQTLQINHLSLPATIHFQSTAE